MKKSLFIILIICGLILPLFASAQILRGPLVPCGREGQAPCTLCDIFRLTQNIINFILVAIFVIAPIFVIVGGIIMLTSAGEADKVSRGKKAITSAIFGLIIALVSWVIINVVLNELARSDVFPWPWNQIQCVGGGITPPEIPPSVRGNICNCGENTLCGSTQFTTEADCFYGCSNYCRTNFTTCVGGDYWCCEAQIMPSGCFASPPAGQWCQRPAPTGSGNWRIGGPMTTSQFGDANTSLVNFINCMYNPINNGLPNLIITSISSAVLCSNPTCDTSTPNCGHVANSCHFGGTNCRGASSAVDFSTSNYTCTQIATVAQFCGGSNAWINYEVNHVHISLNNTTCGCNEGGTPTACPN